MLRFPASVLSLFWICLIFVVRFESLCRYLWYFLGCGVDLGVWRLR